jgi:two-component system response regulator RpfG
VADVYDALIHDRPYRPAWSQADARRYLIEQSGLHFDPEIVDLFLKIV